MTTRRYPTTRSWDRTAWPHDPSRRWTLRLACGLPLVLIAVLASRSGYVSPELAELSARAEQVRRGEGLQQLSAAYPPLPTLTAAILPGGAVWISVISALLGGVALQLVLARLVRRQTGWLVGSALVVALVGSPAVWFQATQNPSQFMALMFLVIAIDGFVRFVVRDDTAGGFASGLALAGAFLCDPVGLIYLIAIVASTPVLARRPGLNPRNRATMIVLAFPTLSVMASWAFLEWRFSGSAFATVWSTTDAFRLDASAMVSAVADVFATVLVSAVFVAVAFVVVLRRPRAAAALAVPAVGMGLTAIIGLPFAPGLVLALLTFVALYSAPRNLRRYEQVFLVVGAAAQLVITLSWRPDRALQSFVEVVCLGASCPLIGT